MELVDFEIGIIWSDGKDKNLEKAECLKNSFAYEETVEGVHHGVCIGDKEIEAFEANNAGKDIADNAIVYGGITGLNDDQKEFLMLPPNHRTFPKLNVENFETELEKCFIKAKWEKFREGTKKEELNKRIEEGNDGKNRSNKEGNGEPKPVDFRDLKATDLKNNKRVIVPDLDDDDEDEIKRNSVKKELKEVFVKYMDKHCDKHGNVLENNLSTKQTKSIKSINDKMKKENLVCFETDKTGNLRLDTLANFENKMKKHIENDEVIPTKKVTSIENKLNEHSEYAVRITKAGENSKQTRRIKGNMKTKDNQLPILSGTYKDHKKVEDEVAGPDLRPIMGATVGPNVGLANFIGDKVVRKVAEMEDVGNVCKSTEEIQHHFEKYNKGRISKELGKKKMIVGSMDIEKYYPRLIAEPAAKKFKEMMIKSDLEFDGIDYVEVSKYLAKNMSKEEKEEESMEDILHIKKVKVKTSKLTKEAIVNNEKESKETNTVDEKEKENDVNNGKESEENIVNKEKEIKETMDTENSGGNKNNVNETKENEVKTLDTPQSGGKDEDKESDVNKEKENETKETLDTENGGGTKEKGNKTKSKEMTTLNNGGNQIDVNETNYDNENENETNKAVNNDEKENKNENGSTNNVDNKDTLPSEDEKAKNKNEEFDPPKRDSSEQEKKCMLAKAMEIMIIAAMKNHTYKFGNKIRIQKFGGPIGLSLTGELADCVMIDWDKLFLIELNKLGISPEIYERFKDDITLLMESMEKGTMFKDGKLIVDLEKKVLDEEKSDDAVTMEVIQEIANSINPMFQFTVDTPSNHENGKLPILDLQVKINEEENNRLDFEFYEKPLKNKKLILSDSAIPAKDKRTILTQECLRRLRNTKVELGKDVQNKHLNDFMVKMKNSGYNKKYRQVGLSCAKLR